MAKTSKVRKNFGGGNKLCDSQQLGPQPKRSKLAKKLPINKKTKKKSIKLSDERDEALFSLKRAASIRTGVPFDCTESARPNDDTGFVEDNNEKQFISSMSQSCTNASTSQTEFSSKVFQIDENSEQQTRENSKYISTDLHSEIYGLLLLRNSVEVPITGQFTVEVIKGKVSILGFQLGVNKAVPVYSSTMTGVLKLKNCNCSDNRNVLLASRQKQIRKLFQENSSNILKDIEDFDTAVIISRVSSTRDSIQVDFATKIIDCQRVFPETPEVHIERSQQLATIETEIWNPVADEIITCYDNMKQDMVVVICGNKNSGKSTFGRFILNSLLNCSDTVYFLECDVGQTEFTPPGLTSLSCIEKPLLGPPFTHQSKPVVSLFFGNITTRANPKTYINCIQEAFYYYQINCKQNGPLVINTQGWIKGMGFPLLIDIIRLSNPSLIVQLKTASDVAKNMFELNQDVIESQPGWIYSSKVELIGNRDEERIVEFSLKGNDRSPGRKDKEEICKTSPTKFLVAPIFEGSLGFDSRLEAVQYRRLALLVYFGNLLVNKEKSCLKNLTVDRPLEYCIPRVLYWKDVALHVMHCKVAPSMIMMSLNFSVVSLAIVSSENIIQLPEDVLPDGPKFLRENSIATHVGFGFIRNIDMERKCFFLITPECEQALKQVNAVLKGSVDVPMGIFNQNSESSAVYCAPEQQSTVRGSSARKPRFNLKRKKFESPVKTASPARQINLFDQETCSSTAND
eukprot:gene6152-6858_t